MVPQSCPDSHGLDIFEDCRLFYRQSLGLGFSDVIYGWIQAMRLWQDYHRSDALPPIRGHIVLIKLFIAGDFKFDPLIKVMSARLLNYKVIFLPPL